MHVDGGTRTGNLRMVTTEKTAVLKRTCLMVRFFALLFLIQIFNLRYIKTHKLNLKEK